MQFNQESDGTRIPLPNPSIDTGMGIERIASVIQGFKSNYETDLLSGLVNYLKDNAPNPKGSEDEKEVSARVIADHIRACTFLISDGVIPSNEGRGYVMRRIIRRAARHGKELGYAPGFFAELVDVFVPMMAEDYPEIKENKEYIQILLEQEEKRFSVTLNQGMKILDEILEKYDGQASAVVDGEEIFKLYDTFGFPVDLADDVLQDKGLTFDQARFETCMKEQRERAKADQDTKKVDLKVSQVYLDLLDKGLANQFIGYQNLSIETDLLAVVKDGVVADSISQGDKVEVLLKETPFYAESGGQVGDIGEITCDEFRIVISDTQAPVSGLNLSHGEVTFSTVEKVDISSVKRVQANVSKQKRIATEANHTATHLLQAALRTVLGDHVKQSGSMVNHEKLRFDFSHYAPVSSSQLKDIETIINQRIRDNEEVLPEEMEFDKAVASGAMAIFGEKYGDHVRVVTAGSSSKELCGGCHTSNTGNIGLFKITTEESIASGIRRIEAVTGGLAIGFVQENINALEQISKKLKVPLGNVQERIEQILVQVKDKDKQIEQYQSELQKVAAEKALSDVQSINGLNVLVLKADPDTNIKSHAGTLLKSMGSGVVLLHKVSDGNKISVVLSVTKDLTDRVNAGAIIKELNPLIEAKGGGSPNIAQCGGTKPAGWEEFKDSFLKKLS